MTFHNGATHFYNELFIPQHLLIAFKSLRLGPPLQISEYIGGVI